MSRLNSRACHEVVDVSKCVHWRYKGARLNNWKLSRCIKMKSCYKWDQSQPIVRLAQTWQCTLNQAVDDAVAALVADELAICYLIGKLASSTLFSFLNQLHISLSDAEC